MSSDYKRLSGTIFGDQKAVGHVLVEHSDKIIEHTWNKLMQIVSDHVSMGKYDQNRKRIPEVDVQMGFYRRERAMMINLDTLFNITHEG